MKKGRNGIRRGVRKEFLGRGLGSWVLQNDSSNKGGYLQSKLKDGRKPQSL
jgi:hypothetical protein